MFIQKTSFELKFSFNPYIYLTSGHLETQGTDDLFSFFLYKHGDSLASAVCRLHAADGQHWTAPARAPFGGIDFAENCNEHDLLFLIECAEQFIRRFGANVITIKSAPSCYAESQFARLSLCYRRSGYEPVSHLKNHFIRVSATEFLHKIKPCEKRRLKKCRNHNFEGSLNAAISSETIHGFIKSIRDRAGFALSLTAGELSKLISLCKNQVVIFCCFDGSKLIGVTVTVRVNALVLYNFLAATLPEYNRFSPMVMIAEAIYIHCQHENIAILDLGTSLDHLGVEKPELIRFKENLGAEVCQKITWQKALDPDAVSVPVKNR